MDIPDDADSGEEDAELYEQLQRQRKAAEPKPVVRQEEKIRELIEKHGEKEKEPAIKKGGTTGLNISITTEFCAVVLSAQQKDDKTKQEAYSGMEKY